MALEDAQAFYDDTLGAGTGFVSAQDAKDALAVTYTDMAAQIPTGVIWAYAGATAPPGWKLCDGTTHGSAALQTLIGSPNAPDLRARFIVGAGATYPLGDEGGEHSHTLTVSEMPSHNHGGWTGSGGSHNHGGLTGAGGGHNHGGATGWNGTHHHSGYRINYLSDSDDSGSGKWIGRSLDQVANVEAGNHQHTISWQGDHQHGISTESAHSHSVSAQGGGLAHNNMPPYYALTYIIKL